MKRLLSLPLAAAALFFLMEKSTAQAGFHALLIGIGDYPAEGGWKKISSSNDLDVISQSLQNRGVPAADIATLSDAAATRDGILNAFRHDFLDKLRPGDVAYFQFSGHGQQVIDEPDGDELDGFDEAIVPYDSPMKFEAGVNEGQKLIRDDELSGLLTEARRRIGPRGNLVVVLDACHSGTGTRGMDVARGTDVIMASPEQIAAASSRMTKQTAYDPVLSGAKSVELAPMAAFFGSAQNQLNFETRDDKGRGIGSLTFSLAKIFSSARPDETYRGLFEKVKIEMSAIAPRQQPQAEGTLDQEIFGGRMRPVAQFFRVTRWNDPASVVINAGSIAGLGEGSKIGLFPPETRDPATARPLATGTVNGARPFEAFLELDRQLDEAEARSAWAYVTEQNFGSLRISVSVNLNQNAAVRQAFLEKAQAFPIIQIDGPQPEISILEKGSTVEMWSAQDMMLDQFGGSPERMADAMVKRILGFVQGKFLRQMDARDASADVSMEIFPILLDQRTGKETSLPTSRNLDEAGNFHVKDGDVLKIRLTNRGTRKVFFTLLDIQPDNKINVLIPDETRSPEEFSIQPGEAGIEIGQRFAISPPSGTEVFKLIATQEPIDLRPIAASRGAGTKSAQSPFERLFGETYGGPAIQSRGGKTMNLASGSVNVSSATFIID